MGIPRSETQKQVMTPMIETSPNDRIIGTGEINMARKPIQVASIAYMTAGPVRVTVVFTASSRDHFRDSSSNRAWNWIA
jgi:hypothetical protein